ncbi:MAG: hypothetical protein CMI52_04565 [Parcubacteria group bacterium]|nr:hypothetical protein [Parcubacteria group bacterium]
MERLKVTSLFAGDGMTEDCWPDPAKVAKHCYAELFHHQVYFEMHSYFVGRIAVHIGVFTAIALAQGCALEEFTERFEQEVLNFYVEEQAAKRGLFSLKTPLKPE